jgi:hypothetical protein
MSPQRKPAPFNYCDYRCERCDERENCRVYRESEERLLNHYAKGEDPYDPEIFLSDLKQIFTKTNNMLKKMAKKRGIDLEEPCDKEMPEINPDEYVIYRLAHEYYTQTNIFIRELERTGIPETTQEDFHDLLWYHTLIAAKTGRLVSGYIDKYDEEFQKQEEEGTLAVIQKGIDVSRKALESMLNELPDHLYTIIDLMELLKNLENQIQTGIRQKVGK